MLRIYSDALQVTKAAVALSRQLAASDATLADQLRRAAISIPLNIAEGSGVIGGNQRLRYSTALGSACEVRSCVDVAATCGYCGSLDPVAADRLDKVIATLFKLTR
ncbi:MAG: four helix bundle protein [Deltaproteobacteria bacterium]|nr:four helix bundle protein [Deltaproteobacteria bacterium]